MVVNLYGKFHYVYVSTVHMHKNAPKNIQTMYIKNSNITHHLWLYLSQHAPYSNVVDDHDFLLGYMHD